MSPKNVVSSFILPPPPPPPPPTCAVSLQIYCKYRSFLGEDMSRGILRGEYEQEKYIQSIALFLLL